MDWHRQTQIEEERNLDRIYRIGRIRTKIYANIYLIRLLEVYDKLKEY